jgi:HK97 family phage portal protein
MALFSRLQSALTDSWSDSPLDALNLRTEWASPPSIDIRNSSTLGAPDARLMEALVGLPAAAGKIVTKETALRVAAFLAGVKMMASDIAKMPLVLNQTKWTDAGKRTWAATDDPLYGILMYVFNNWQTAYQARWFLAAQLIMNGNCYCQKITDQAGDIQALIPLNAWAMQPHWDRSTPTPQLLYRYTEPGQGGTREFKPSELWVTTALNFEGCGMQGSPITLLGKEAISLLMAAEEASGRTMANGLGMSGFLTYSTGDNAPDEVQVQNVVDALKDNFAGSKNFGKFTSIPDTYKWNQMAFTSVEAELLATRKWSENEVVRMLGGAPLLVKLGLGEQNSTYASSSAFLDEYFNTSLLPYCTSIEQSITRDLIPRIRWGKTVAKHDSWVIMRGSPQERATYYASRIANGQMSPNMISVLEDEDTLPGFGDWRFFPANSGAFDPASGECFLPAQKQAVPDPDEESVPTPDDEGKAAETPPPPDDAPDADNEAVKNRLKFLASAAVERILRKESKSGTDSKFVSEVLMIPIELAVSYETNRANLTEDQAREALIALATGETK